ncbi:MAG: alpha/beta hydrolase [Polaromonas sp.]|nr:alpha/beta hydrolase [Polaromonas sp.]
MLIACSRTLLRMALLSGALVGSLGATAQPQPEVRELTTRPGVTLRFVYLRAANPVASAVLFQGGPGNIGIFPNGSMRDGGFLAGGGQNFVAHGISVVIPDVPSDRRHLDGYRASEAHAQDNAALIEFLRQQAPVPVWAVGTSNGSLSAAAAAARLQGKGPDGLVLTSTVTREGRTRGLAHVVSEVPLQDVKVPVLLVHHKDDACYVTPYDAMPGLTAALSAAPRVALITAQGGSNNGNPCHAGHHQFQGIEAAVARDIADWIRAAPLK